MTLALVPLLFGLAPGSVRLAHHRGAISATSPQIRTSVAGIRMGGRTDDDLWPWKYEFKMGRLAAMLEAQVHGAVATRRLPSGLLIVANRQRCAKRYVKWQKIVR